MKQKDYSYRQLFFVMKGIISLLAFFVLTTSVLQSQNLLFTTQGQVDSFPINYPNHSVINGWIKIYGDDITNLDSLIQIEAILNSLEIFMADNLISIEGLINVSHIGYSIVIFDNPLLSSLEGLNNIDSNHHIFRIAGNHALTDLSDLESLVYVQDLGIYQNASLTSLNGLEALDTIGGALAVSYNPILNNIEALENLNKVGNQLILSNNPNLENLHGLESLRSIGLDLFIHDCTNLSTLSGLVNLRSVGHLHIYHCPSLITLSGLDSLTSIMGGHLKIYENDSLQTLSGIDNIEAESITFLRIRVNPQLSTCEVQSICDYLANPNGTIEIFGNAQGCSNSVEVEEACTVGILEQESDLQRSTYPNPFTTSTNIEYELTEPSRVQLTMYNAIGEIVYQAVDRMMPQGKHSFTWTADRLPEGLYYAVLKSEEGVAVVKMVKQ